MLSLLWKEGEVDVITEGLIESILYARLELDALEVALRTAKGEQQKPLIEAKLAMSNEYEDVSARILKEIPDGINYIHLRDSWYGVRFKGQSGIKLAVLPLQEKDLFMLERDGRRLRNLSESDLKTAYEGCKDPDEEKLYEVRVDKRCREQLLEYLGVHLDLPVPEPVKEKLVGTCDEDEPTGIRITAHAGMKYAQRIIGIANETKAMEYYQANMSQINALITAGVVGAERVWVDEDGIEYHFDKDNIMYVYGFDPVPSVITLYEENFGWGKERNRYLVLEQLKDLSALKAAIDHMEAEHWEDSSKRIDECEQISHDIKLLEAQVVALSARRSALMALNEESNQNLALKRQEFVREFRKLFTDRESKKLRVE